MACVTITSKAGIGGSRTATCGKAAMFDLRSPASKDLHGHPQPVPSRTHSIHARTVKTWDGDYGRIPVAAAISGCCLIDGIRHGITRHGWTLSALAHRTELPMPMLRSIMDWVPGLPGADAVWWSLELDALAATYGRRFHCLSSRVSSIQLGQIARSLLRRSGITWADFSRRATRPNSGGLLPAGTGGWDGEDQLGILDRLAVAGGVAPVLSA